MQIRYLAETWISIEYKAGLWLKKFYIYIEKIKCEISTYKNSGGKEKDKTETAIGARREVLLRR